MNMIPVTKHTIYYYVHELDEDLYQLSKSHYDNTFYRDVTEQLTNLMHFSVMQTIFLSQHIQVIDEP